VAQTVVHLAEDAAEEGIVHAELQTGLKFDPGNAEAEFATRQKWSSLFAARREALQANPSLSLMFILALPAKCKTAQHAQEAMKLLRSVEGFEEAAMAGCSYFCGESKISDYSAPLAAFKEAGYRLVCIHAGEGEPSKGDGPQRVRDALKVGAERIGHGIEAAADEALMAELRRKGTCLEVCPLSNRALGCCPAATTRVPRVPFCVAGLASHPLPPFAPWCAMQPEL